MKFLDSGVESCRNKDIRLFYVLHMSLFLCQGGDPLRCIYIMFWIPVATYRD